MSYLLRLQHYLRSPEAIDPAGAWVALEEGEAPPLLARGEQLCSDILRSPSIAPIDMLEYAARLLLLEPGALPQLGRLFATSQAFGHGPTHQQARKALATRCRAIERDMASWLPAFTTTLFAQMRALGPLDAGTLARTFVNSAMQEMMAHDLGIDAGQLPALSETFFSLRPTRHRLETLDREVGCLLEALEAALVERNRPTEEAALLASLQVIGNEPLEASLVHGMLRETTETTTPALKALFTEAAAVNLLGRFALDDVCFGDLALRKGQMVFVSPHLVHGDVQQAGSDLETHSLSFGKGAHACLGQILSMHLARAFFEELSRNEFTPPSGAIRSMRTDVMLRTLTTPTSTAR